MAWEVAARGPLLVSILAAYRAVSANAWRAELTCACCGSKTERERREKRERKVHAGFAHLQHFVSGDIFAAHLLVGVVTVCRCVSALPVEEGTRLVFGSHGPV